jgi:hypothetical protein
MEDKVKQVFESIIQKTNEKKIPWQFVGPKKDRFQATVGETQILFFTNGVIYYLIVTSKDNEIIVQQRFHPTIEREYHRRAADLFKDIKKQLINYDGTIDDLIKNLGDL